MSEHSSRRRPMTAAAALLALLAAVSGPASASRGRPAAGDAVARAVAVQVNASGHVVAKARGDQSNRASGASVAIPEVLEVRTAESVAATQVRSALAARAETHLGGVRLRASAARVGEVTDRALTEAEAAIRLALQAACAARVRVEGDAVVAAGVRGMAHGGAGTPFGYLVVDASLEAALRAEATAVLDSEDGSDLLCDSRIVRLAGRIVAAFAPAVREAVDAQLSVSLSALRTRCELGRRGGTAGTEIVVHRRTAALLGLNGDLDGDGVLVRPGPNTGVSLGGGVSLVLNEQHRRSRARREAHITVNGAVLRVDGIVAVTLASSRCELRGDVTASSVASFVAGAYVRAAIQL